MGEFDNNADNVACDELKELLAMTGVLNVPSSDVIYPLVIVAVFEPFPLVSTRSTVCGCELALIDEITDDNDVGFDNCDFYKQEQKSHQLLIIIFC